VVSLAGGAGSRWTKGAGVVKALNPFCRSEASLAASSKCISPKSRRAARTYGSSVPHVFTTSYLTHDPVERYLAAVDNYGYEGPVHLSPGKTVGLRWSR